MTYMQNTIRHSRLSTCTCTCTSTSVLATNATIKGREGVESPSSELPRVAASQMPSHTIFNIFNMQYIQYAHLLDNYSTRQLLLLIGSWVKNVSDGFFRFEFASSCFRLVEFDLFLFFEFEIVRLPSFPTRRPIQQPTLTLIPWKRVHCLIQSQSPPQCRKAGLSVCLETKYLSSAGEVMRT
jgi:uncharacterized protein (DUF1499 family)